MDLLNVCRLPTTLPPCAPCAGERTHACFQLKVFQAPTLEARTIESVYSSLAD